MHGWYANELMKQTTLCFYHVFLNNFTTDLSCASPQAIPQCPPPSLQLSGLLLALEGLGHPLHAGFALLQLLLPLLEGLALGLLRCDLRKRKHI